MRFQVVPAAYLVLRRGGEVLLQLRRGTGYMDGYWACAAAGHVERGESVTAAATREAREELGIEVAATDLAGLTGMHRTNGTGAPIDERVDWFFACERWTGDPALQEPDKAADLRWFSLGALPEPVVPHERAVLEALADGAVPAVMTFGF
ncbi:NUDIX hydrolase [Cellulomonas sp. ICMP 17802]|uniref:NUDIX hydrolase n=1 Tax=Cellulomonas sp. ICMP 17802 TaxID=3239199 RepID=UPI00351BC769